ncbi:uncharacterized protein ML1173, partial [Arthrobacter sp. Hiyo6]
MKLTIVGCTGSFPGPGSPASCYLLTAHDGERSWKIVLDLGSGALGAIQRYTDLEDIDAIFLTTCTRTLHGPMWSPRRGPRGTG